MKVRLFSTIDCEVTEETPRRYVVNLNGESIQVPKHSATPLPEFAPAIAKYVNDHGVVGSQGYSPPCLVGKTLGRSNGTGAFCFASGIHYV